MNNPLWVCRLQFDENGRPVTALHRRYSVETESCLPQEGSKSSIGKDAPLSILGDQRVRVTVPTQ